MEALLAPIPPSLLLSTLLALLWATLWYVWRGGGWGDWLVYVLAALLGFGAGQLVGWLWGSPLPAVGEVHVIEGTVLSWLALLLVTRARRR